MKKLTLAVLMTAFFAKTSFAADVLPENRDLEPPASNGLWYYEIGGSNSIIQPRYLKTRFRLDGGIESNGNLMCSTLDPNVSIENIMNGVKKGWTSLQRNIESTVDGVISSLPGLALYYANPGIYDMVNSALLAAQDQFQVEIASCQTLTQDLISAKPNYQWVKASGYEKYQEFFNKATGRGTAADRADAGDVVKEMEADVGKDGVRDICGNKRGGEGQVAIKMSESVWAGFNRLLGRNNCDLSPVPNSSTGSDNPMFTKYWSTPEAAQDWLVDVFGETEINTDPDKPPRKNKPGAGLVSKIQEQTVDIKEELVSLIDQVKNDGYEPSLRDLQAISAPGTLVTKEVVLALAGIGGVDNSILVDRLAVDMASQRVLLRAMEMRRILYNAEMVNEVFVNEPARETVASWREGLTEQMNMVREEMELKRFLNSNTILTILNKKYNSNREAMR